jgi:hypothetical protein
VDVSGLVIGNEYVFHCNIESKEYKGKWYTEVTLWKVDTKTRISVNDFLKTTQSYQNKQLGLNEEGVPDFDPLADYEEHEPDWDRVIASGTTANLPESLRRHYNIDNPATSSSETGDLDESEPDWGNIIMSGNASNSPDRLKISAGSAGLTSEDISGSENDTPLDKAESLKPSKGNLKIDPGKLENIHLSGKTTNFEKEEEDLDDSVFII